jgi:hypothetical protein
MVFPEVRYLGPAHSASRAPLQANTAETARELDSRTSDGIHVRLLWHPEGGHVSVAVNDTKTGEQFVLPVRDGQRALDVFHHPYAYAYAASRQPCGGEPCPNSADSALAA